MAASHLLLWALLTVGASLFVCPGEPGFLGEYYRTISKAMDGTNPAAYGSVLFGMIIRYEREPAVQYSTVLICFFFL